MRNQSQIRAAKQVAKNKFTWPGGYPLFTVCNDGGTLCANCTKENFTLIARATRDHDNSGWDVAGSEINWEDRTLTCDNCYATIECAYGDDE
jgi:hypothetical protein